MRLLHTADWHLGRGFHGASLLSAQAIVLDHLIEVARSEQPDALVVAGDVFDRAFPPLDAIELYDETVKRLADAGICTVITSGNHDSAIRLGMNARIGEAAGIHVRTRVDRIADPVLLPGAGAEAPLAIYAVPYLDPPSCAASLGALQSSHAGVLGAALGQIAVDRARRADARVVVIAHAVVAGGRPTSESGEARVERSIDVGGVSAVPGELFGDLDYVALGHLHRPQGIGERIRYSGAPLPFGFDEAGDRKSIALIDLAGTGTPAVELISTPQPRGLSRLTGTLEDLLTLPDHAGAEGDWVEATLTDRLRPKQAMDQLRRRFPHVLKLEHCPDRSGTDLAAPENYSERILGRTELQVAEQFLAEVRGGTTVDADEHALLEASLEALAREEALR